MRIIKDSKWYLAVRQSIVTGEFYINPKSKHHYFDGDKCLCGKYIWGAREEYETNNITDEDVLKDSSIVCQKCFKKWLKLKD